MSVAMVLPPAAWLVNMDGFATGATSPKGSSSVLSRLEQWSPTRPRDPAEIMAKIATACERREHALELKKFLARHESRTNAVKKREAEAAAKLQSVIDAKVAAARARAESAKKEAALKASKMSNVKVEGFRAEEAASINLTKELNEKRHVEALARAEAAKKRRAQRGAERAQQVSAKVGELRAREAEQLSAKRQAQMEREHAASLRAEASKMDSALKAIREVARVEATKWAVREQSETEAASKREKLEAKANKAALRAEQGRADKVHKAANMATPRKKRSLSGKVKSSDEDSPAKVFIVPACPPPVARPIAIDFANLFLLAEKDRNSCGSPVQARLAQWAPKRALAACEVEAKVSQALARRDLQLRLKASKASRSSAKRDAVQRSLRGLALERSIKARELTGKVERARARAEASKGGTSRKGGERALKSADKAAARKAQDLAARALRMKALRARFASASARHEELLVGKQEKAGAMATLSPAKRAKAVASAALPDEPAIAFPEQQGSDNGNPEKAAGVLPPPAPTADDEAEAEARAPRSLVLSILAEHRSRTPSPTGTPPASAPDKELPLALAAPTKGLKVTTLRRDSPTGSHVISVVTPILADEADKRADAQGPAK